MTGLEAALTLANHINLACARCVNVCVQPTVLPPTCAFVVVLKDSRQVLWSHLLRNCKPSNDGKGVKTNEGLQLAFSYAKVFFCLHRAIGPLYGSDTPNSCH